MTTITPSMIAVADRLKQHAETGVYHGLMSEMDTPYFEQAKGLCLAPGLSTSLIFTRDTGHHSSGWFKNPDYERCYHLSLSFWHYDIQAVSLSPAPYDRKLAALWVQVFYPKWMSYVWDESNLTHKEIPDTPIQWQTIPEITGQHEIHHYRVFCDPAWQPIKPRGEVYSQEFTEKGWRSFSQQQGGKAK